MGSVQCSVIKGEWRTHAEQSAAARRLLGEIVGGAAPVEHDVQGAPYLPSRPDLHISISHCRTAVAVAVSTQGPVGVDVECRRKIGDGLIQRVCTPEEQQSIGASDDPQMAFLRLWTRKEAVLKCRGTGIKGFGSMVAALEEGDCNVSDVETGVPDVVASLATSLRVTGG